MRRLVINEQLSLDGVMQGPGGPEEDTRGGFEHGGWAMQYFDESMGKASALGMESAGALLIGRRTYEIFAGYWGAPTRAAAAVKIRAATPSQLP